MWIILVINLLVAMAIAYFGLKERQEDFNLCNENKQLGERTKNTAPSIDEGMNLVFLLAVLPNFVSLMIKLNTPINVVSSKGDEIYGF